MSHTVQFASAVCEKDSNRFSETLPRKILPINPSVTTKHKFNSAGKKVEHQTIQIFLVPTYRGAISSHF